MAAIDLEELTKGKVHNLSGRLRGLAARDLFHLDRLDQSGEPVEVHIPDHVYAVTPSFIQGLFGKSVEQLGGNAQAFRRNYRFIAPALVLDQVEKGLSAILTNRNISEIR
jgi:hypothetical protein